MAGYLLERNFTAAGGPAGGAVQGVGPESASAADDVDHGDLPYPRVLNISVLGLSKLATWRVVNRMGVVRTKKCYRFAIVATR